MHYSTGNVERGNENISGTNAVYMYLLTVTVIVFFKNILPMNQF